MLRSRDDVQRRKTLALLLFLCMCILFDFTLAVEFLMCKIVQLAVRCMIGPRAAHPHGHPVALPATIPCIIPKVLQHHCMVVVESERSGHLVRGIECFGVLVD